MKLLYITSLSGKRVNGFMRSAILAAKQLGFEFVMACNTNGSDKEGYEEDCKSYGIRLEHICFNRNPFSSQNIKAYQQLLELMKKEHFDIVHCNTPIGGLLGRICARKTKIPCVIYMAHGFHFWKGAPIKNWLLYYPVELFLSKWTDVLITITQEDFELSKKMKAKRNSYIHGVGIDLSNFVRRKSADRNVELRNELAIPTDAIVLLSVGELNKNKNQKIVIRAISELKRTDVYYVICGEGELFDEYKVLTQKLGISDKVVMTGFRSDVYEFYRMADCYIHPSIREGLPASIVEAMATGVPVLATDFRGIRDIIPNRERLFDSSSISDTVRVLNNWLNESSDDSEQENGVVDYYNLDSVVNEFVRLYKSI